MIVTPEARKERHDLPHVLAQFDVDTGRRLVEEQDARLVRQRFGDQEPALHAAGERPDFIALLVPQRQIAQHLGNEIGIVTLAEEPAAEGHRPPHGLESIGRQLLRHEADQRARVAIVLDDVVPIDGDFALRGIDDPAYDVDQRRLAGAVRPQQGEDFTIVYVEIDVLESAKAGGIGFRDVRDGNDRLHDPLIA